MISLGKKVRVVLDTVDYIGTTTDFRDGILKLVEVEKVYGDMSYDDEEEKQEDDYPLQLEKWKTPPKEEKEDEEGNECFDEVFINWNRVISVEILNQDEEETEPEKGGDTDDDEVDLR